MASVDQLHGDPHVERYLETDGEEGYHWNGTQILILFTTGNKSGTQRRHALIFRPWGDNTYLVVASKGGTDAPPAWFMNLEAEPNAEVQIKGDRFPVRARVATDDRAGPVLVVVELERVVRAGGGPGVGQALRTARRTGRGPVRHRHRARGQVRAAGGLTPPA